MRFLRTLQYALCLCFLFFAPYIMAVQEIEDESFNEGSFSLESSAPANSTPPVTIEVLAEDTSIQPGRPFWIAVRLNMADHWHSYWKNPGDIGMPTKVEWKLPEGFQAGQVEWPYPTRFTQNASTIFGYEGQVLLLTHVIPPPSLPIDKPVKISADVSWLVCSDSACIPGQETADLEVPASTDTPKPNAQVADDFAKARGMLPKKPWNLRASRKNKFVELQMHPPKSLTAPITSAIFFPDSKNVIDTKAESFFKAHKPGEYLLVLKDLEDAQPKRLTGVLVVASESQAEAIDVDIAIHTPDDDEEIASADVPSLLPAMTDDRHASPANSTQEQTIPGTNVEFEGGVALALLFAFLGGLILNLMPCVLPVVSFKVFSFVKMAGQDRSLTFKHGLAFSAGVIVSFWVFAGLMLVLQTYGRSVGWGFQLQEPLFVAVLGAVMLMFGLSMFGVFEFGTSLTSIAGQVQNTTGKTTSGLIHSFMSGILATAVATPCTGPFLGSAIGFAFTLPPVWALLIFTSLGLGMASPYLILAAYPQFLRFLPKPGPWMVTFKELMGFFMFATVLWLVWVFSAQTNSFATFLLLSGFLLLSVSAWIFGRWCTPVQKKTTRLVGSVFALSCVIIASFAIMTATSPSISAAEDGVKSAAGASADLWEDFSAERIAELQKKGTPVLVDFTAKWCLICQANHLILSTSDVSQKLDELGVVRMKADYTRSDPAITDALRKFGRNGVPLYLLYGKDPSQPPRILPQVLTPEIVIDSLNKL